MALHWLASKKIGSLGDLNLESEHCHRSHPNHQASAGYLLSSKTFFYPFLRSWGVLLKEITNHRRWWRVQPQGNANAKWWNSLIDGEWYGLKAMTPGLQASRSRARALNVHFYLPFHASEPGSSSGSWDSAGKTQGLPVVLYRSSAQWKKRLLWEKEIQNCP